MCNLFYRVLCLSPSKRKNPESEVEVYRVTNVSTPTSVCHVEAL